MRDSHSLALSINVSAPLCASSRCNLRQFTGQRATARVLGHGCTGQRGKKAQSSPTVRNYRTLLRASLVQAVTRYCGGFVFVYRRTLRCLHCARCRYALIALRLTSALLSCPVSLFSPFLRVYIYLSEATLVRDATLLFAKVNRSSRVSLANFDNTIICHTVYTLCCAVPSNALLGGLL